MYSPAVIFRKFERKFYPKLFYSSLKKMDRFIQGTRLVVMCGLGLKAQSWPKLALKSPAKPWP